MRTHTEVLMDLLARWQNGDVSNLILRRDLSGMAASAALLEKHNADLLEALEDLVEAEDHVPWDDYSEQAHHHNIEAAVIRARKAIEKAKGDM